MTYETIRYILSQKHSRHNRYPKLCPIRLYLRKLGNDDKLLVLHEVLDRRPERRKFRERWWVPSINQAVRTRCTHILKHITCSSMSCKGSKAAIIPAAFFSEKNNREASSRPSCQSSCHRIATRMSSLLTINAYNTVNGCLVRQFLGKFTCDTILGLCSRIRSIIAMAASWRATLEDLEATVRG